VLDLLKYSNTRCFFSVNCLSVEQIFHRNSCYNFIGNLILIESKSNEDVIEGEVLFSEDIYNMLPFLFV